MAEILEMQPIKITANYKPPKVSFDFEGARKAGISPMDIVKELEKSGKVNFDFSGARKAGISDEEIYQELYKRSQASDASYDLDSIEPGAPDDDYATLDQQATPEEPTTKLTPKLAQNVDTQSTNPMQSIMTFGSDGQAAPMTVGTDTYSQEQAIAAEREKRDKESDWYIDPITGERVASSKISGQAEPDYPTLVFTRLGIFGGPGMMGEAAIKTLAHDTAKFSSELLGKADELLSNSQLKNFSGPEGGVSNEAKIYLARHATNPEITEDVIAQVLAGVKTSDQAYVLARFFGDANFIKQAVRGDGDAVAALLRADLVRGKQKVVSAVGEVDVEGAIAKYADVKEHLRSTEGTVVRDASSLKQAADTIVAKFRPQDTTTGAVQLVSDSGYGLAIRMQNLLANTNGKLSLSQAFEMRPEINSLLRKARDPLEKANLKSMKDNLDDFISTMATPEQKAMVDDAISTYARTMENRDVLEFINKNTVDGVAVNWTKLHRELNEAGLRSPEAVYALRITEAFSKKFGNDTKLAAYARAAGSNLDAGGAMGAYGAFVNFFKNHFTMWGNRAENIKIQKAIINSLKNSKTNYDFVDNIRANKNIPDEFKGKDLDQAIMQIEYKPGARTTGDVNLEPIVTPAGGAEQIVPKTEAASVQTPAASDLHKAFNDSGLVDIQKLDDEEFPEAFSFGGTIIPFKDTGKIVMLDSSGLKNGSNLGKDMYNKVWDALDKTGRLQRVDNLTEVNTIRFPINAYNRQLSKGSVPIEGGKDKLKDLVSSAIIKLNKELSSKGLPNLDRLTDEQIAKVGPVLGADRNFRANVKTLELYKAAAQLLKHKRTLSTTALLPFLDAAYEEGQ